MNQATVISRAVVECLLDAGIRDVVLAPGSRSAGLAFALAQAEAAGTLTMHVRIDEREAGFLALGIAKRDRNPVAVVVTSGTAVANLLPSIVEAHYSAVPLVVLTADRPARMRGRGAPQTIDQTNFASRYVAAEIDMDASASGATEIHQTVTSALTCGLGVRRAPVHINIQFDLPLLPDEADVEWVPANSNTQSSTADANTPTGETASMSVPARGVLVVGDLNDQALALDAGALASSLGWPVVWEPSSGAHSSPTALDHGPLLVSHMPTPDMVLTVGAVGLSRSVLAMLRATPRHVAVHAPSSGPNLPDPTLTASEILNELPRAQTQVDSSWLLAWQAADRVAGEVIAQALRGQSLTGASASVHVWNHLPNDAQLLVGASWPVRHLEAYAPKRDGVRVFGNRGANGIDGLIATAWGLALNHLARTYALVGDVSFLYGAHGLLSAAEHKPNLTVVVLDNDGGGIFSQLEQAAPAYQKHFERIFGTPHGRDLWAVAESLGAAAVRVITQDELLAALRRTDALPGVHIIIVTTATRRSEAALLRDLASKVAAEITSQ